MVVVVGTPIDEFLNPSMTVFERTVDQIAPHLQPGTLVVLRSTVYPGTTEYIAEALADTGLRCGRRLLPGANRRGPRARGALEPAPDRRRGRPGRRRPGRGAVPQSDSQIIRSTTKEAELAKLFTNAWRYIKFAAANQFFDDRP